MKMNFATLLNKTGCRAEILMRMGKGQLKEDRNDRENRSMRDGRRDGRMKGDEDEGRAMKQKQGKGQRESETPKYQFF